MVEVVDGFPVYTWGQSGEGGYKCDCPDWTKRQDANPRSKFPSEKGTRSWEASQAGSDGDCKHIMCVKLMEREGDFSSISNPPEPEKEITFEFPKGTTDKGDGFGFKQPKGW